MSDLEDLGRLRAFEEGVRTSLHDHADRISPSHRLDVILDAEAPGRRRTYYWVAGVAAIFVLVAALGVGYLLGNNGMRTASSTGAAAPAQKDQAGTKGGTTPSAARPESTSAFPAATWAMPVYYVVTGTSASPWLLTRTFVNVPDPGDRTAHVQAAVTAALGGGSSGSGVYGLQKPWLPGTTATVTTTDTQLGIVLSQAGVAGLSADQQRIAVQSLVWTATAAAQLTVGVHVEVSGGQAVFATMPAGTYARPATSYTDLVPIWVDGPTPGASVSSPVTVTGQACVFEAQFEWQLLQGTAVVDSGSTSATSGCPTQGSYSISLGTRPAGTYTIRVYDLSMKDGSVFYETRVTFTVG